MITYYFLFLFYYAVAFFIFETTHIDHTLYVCEEKPGDGDHLQQF